MYDALRYISKYYTVTNGFTKTDGNGSGCNIYHDTLPRTGSRLDRNKVLRHDGLPRTRNPPPTMHYLQGDSFKVKDLQYLCLNLYSSLNFQTHFTFAKLDIDCYDIYRSKSVRAYRAVSCSHNPLQAFPLPTYILT